MAAACCCLLILAAATATSSNNTGAVDDWCLMTSFCPNDKISFELDDVVHAVPWTQATAITTNTFQTSNNFLEKKLLVVMVIII